MRLTRNPAGVRRDFEALEKRRFQAMRLLEQGLNQSEVARRLKWSGKRWRGETSIIASFPALCLAATVTFSFTVPQSPPTSANERPSTTQQ